MTTAPQFPLEHWTTRQLYKSELAFCLVLPSLRDLQRVLPEQQESGTATLHVWPCLLGNASKGSRSALAQGGLPGADHSHLNEPGQQKIVLPSRHLILRFFLGQHAHLWVLLIKFLQGDYNVSCACL